MSRCAGWLHACLSFISAARMIPEALDPGGLLGLLDHLVDNRLVERRLLPARWQSMRISTFSGRSLMMLLSVFSRRRMNGAGRLAQTLCRALIAPALDRRGVAALEHRGRASRPGSRTAWSSSTRSWTSSTRGRLAPAATFQRCSANPIERYRDPARDKASAAGDRAVHPAPPKTDRQHHQRPAGQDRDAGRLPSDARAGDALPGGRGRDAREGRARGRASSARG